MTGPRAPRGARGPRRFAAAFALLAVLAAGCVERRLIVRSDPPGAILFLDGEEIGPTPATVSFTHYGTRRIVLRMPGRVTHESLYRTPIPWYQIFPIDFFAEVIVPAKIVDEHEVGPFILIPNAVDDASTQDLLERASATREAIAPKAAPPDEGDDTPGESDAPGGAPPAEEPPQDR